MREILQPCTCSHCTEESERRVLAQRHSPSDDLSVEEASILTLLKESGPQTTFGIARELFDGDYMRAFNVLRRPVEVGIVQKQLRPGTRRGYLFTLADDA